MASSQTELFPAEPDTLVLNAKSQVVREMKATVKRAAVFDELARRHLELSKGDIGYARENSPLTWGSVDKERGGPNNPRTLIGQAFTDKQLYLLKEHWEYLFMTWYTGSLARQVRAFEDNIRRAHATD